jgi:chromosome segregation ATPase
VKVEKAGLERAASARKAAFMVESIMYLGIGFLFAALGLLGVVPLVHGRAVRLTTRRLEGAFPSSMAEMWADKDLLRADFAMSTRRLEKNVEQLQSRNASQLAELGKKADAINRLKIELGALRDQLRALEEGLAAKAIGVQNAERALSDRDSELVKLAGELDERSTLVDAQKAEIVALKTLVEAKATAVHEAERALSDKDSELAKLAGELDERSTLADAQRVEIIALKTQVEAKATAVHEAERALSDKDSELAKLAGELDQRSTLVDAQKAEIIALKTQVETKATALVEAERALSDKDSELAKLAGELDQRSTLVAAQKAEIIALKIEVEGLKDRLDGARNGLKAAKDRQDAERIELKVVTQELMEERGKFENFHRRVAELVQQVMARTTQDKVRDRRAQDLENLFVEQSRLLNERELELKHLRGEIEVASKVEADLRIAIIEIEDRANSATHTLEAEKAELQGALDRANGECVRLAYELKRESWAA